MLADALAWEDAELDDLEMFRDVPHINHFVWRGVLRRVTEQAEHIKWLNKDKDQAVQEARLFQRAIDMLDKHF